MSWDRPTERFLVYLERLVAACVARDAAELDKLQRLNVSSHLPRGVREEVEYFRRAGDTLRAPLKLMRHVHKMRQLAVAESTTTQPAQLPLPLPDATRSARPKTAADRRRVVRRLK